MRTLNVSISDVEYSKFGIPSERLNFTDFIDIISKELMRQNLNRSVALAEKYSLSSMTMEEITNKEKTEEFSTNGIVPPRRKGSLTEGYGFWENNASFNEF